MPTNCDTARDLGFLLPLAAGLGLVFAIPIVLVVWLFDWLAGRAQSKPPRKRSLATLVFSENALISATVLALNRGFCFWVGCKCFVLLGRRADFRLSPLLSTKGEGG